ncbi:uncharacterized protein LOC108733914 [Agrilus planipennis]|uniref:Uncharacterized protein LOC108733914 n=1 Tax=Agrilus planipennis TaxID=224129 RepID=A0A1W4WJY8_AGRPL|nr:uncharacterized protein LOC108733914 [Agrilus planipennis]XP_018320768.1 uncharacterized protein LOC108733914 [Agrilus planipennis]XP_018320770.1 uncharacterized protein LOC108733914 [Agrilus planipennis]XP_018320771.1 uncharacterized protein LOC108733914 [Agrilus planipennis]XP_018320772.1 uncharacterized protein LOC108733914 [Agrilus planipennis]XP_018320773.1 uncharacterized protein LOC108733914 [Agrilus planipennis]XP_018320774.1 uncharacterized protein LOC108733914 [Agrilus planipenni
MLSNNKDSESTPICRCRVLYLGSAVPQQSKDGLQGIQQPLRELYPEDGAAGAKGIDSWLSVWSNGILLENVDENHKKITRFFPIESLHYCAAVRYVLVPEKNSSSPLPSSTASPRFLPLDSPFARAPSSVHPPLFAAILRRTQGIKVLECHAFICRREAAANALVRCCFHAYADSSYAKQGEQLVVTSPQSGSSIYGTLGPSSNVGEPTSRLEEWRVATSSTPARSVSGSTMTIDAVGKDDISIYNGDENHKVWAGSQDNLDGGGGGGIYEAYSTSTVGRTPRPRQITAPVPVPPPPIIKEKMSKNKSNPKNMKRYQSTEDLMYAPTMNGRAGGGGGSLAGTMPKHMKQPHRPMPPHQPLYIMPHPQQTLPNPKFFKHYGNTFSHRPRGKVLIPGRPVAPPLVPMAPLVLPATVTKNRKKNKQMLEEPIYGRAASTYGAIPPNYPPPPGSEYMMPPPHFATIESKGKSKKNKDKLLNSKKLAQSMNGLDQDPVLQDADESPFDTGIYKRKGHLNERAFSYSIRQEHRSRSYGSLANLKFATPIPNGVSHDAEERGEDLKKEREILQMVQDLDLSGDDLERSEVPRAIYEARGPLPPVILGPHQQNGIRHHRR